MMTVAPDGRNAPTAGKSPFLTFQYCSMRWASVEKLRRPRGRRALQGPPDLFDARGTFRLVRALDLDQQRRRVRAERGQKIRHAGLAPHRSEARALDEPDCRDGLVLQTRHRLAGTD